jgi:Tfp pilus assembly protein PilF
MGPGNLKKSLDHLTQAVRLAPENSSNHLFLAQTMMRLGRKEEARQELAKVLSPPSHALIPKELEKDQRQAAKLLKELDSAI